MYDIWHSTWKVSYFYFTKLNPFRGFKNMSYQSKSVECKIICAIIMAEKRSFFSLDKIWWKKFTNFFLSDLRVNYFHTNPLGSLKDIQKFKSYRYALPTQYLSIYNAYIDLAVKYSWLFYFHLLTWPGIDFLNEQMWPWPEWPKLHMKLQI